MSQLKRRPARPASLRPQVKFIRIGPHRFPPTWQPLDWLIPQEGQQFYIHHGHTDPNDHSACGPLLLCCQHALEKFQRLPDAPFVESAQWSLKRGSELAPFLERGARMLYFIFCDPVRPEGLWFIGLEGETLWQILFKQQPLELLLQFDQVQRLA